MIILRSVDKTRDISESTRRLHFRIEPRFVRKCLVDIVSIRFRWADVIKPTPFFIYCHESDDLNVAKTLERVFHDAYRKQSAIKLLMFDVTVSAAGPNFVKLAFIMSANVLANTHLPYPKSK